MMISLLQSFETVRCVSSSTPSEGRSLPRPLAELNTALIHPSLSVPLPVPACVPCSYMKHAFPKDELRPLSRTGKNSLPELGADGDVDQDSYHGVALTLIDALSTIAVIEADLGDSGWDSLNCSTAAGASGKTPATDTGQEEKSLFRRSVAQILETVDFDQDVKVNLFEANIRALGGLLSGHMLAPQFYGTDADTETKEEYTGGLLELARDLGLRLLRAFPQHSDISIPSKTAATAANSVRSDEEKPTSAEEARDWCEGRLPYNWINLQKGRTGDESPLSCTAAAGTLVLEFGLLSFLTGDNRFYEAADDALYCVWMMRSPLDLCGNSLDVEWNVFVDSHAGIGAGIDSFYEYLLKAYVLFGDPKYLLMFDVSYTAARKHLRLEKDPAWYIEVDWNSGRPIFQDFNSLQAFWPGLQTLAGDVEEADETWSRYLRVWEEFGGLPERFFLFDDCYTFKDPNTCLHSMKYYPLRPELIESTYYLWTATKDPKYRKSGEVFFPTFEEKAWTEGGIASVSNVRGHVLEDDMPSYFLAETLKYLFMLYQEPGPGARWDEWIFTTEGHLLPVLRGVHEYVADHPRPQFFSPDQKHRMAELDRVSACPEVAVHRSQMRSAPERTSFSSPPAPHPNLSSAAAGATGAEVPSEMRVICTQTEDGELEGCSLVPMHRSRAV